MDLYDEFFSISKSLEKANVRYSLIGGIAMAVYDYPRATKDIDFLVHPSDLDKFKSCLIGLDYFESTKPWTFQKTKVTLHRFLKTEGSEMSLVDCILADSDMHKEVIERSVQEEWEDGKVNVATKEDIIALKKLRSSKQDLADIERLEGND